MLAARLPQVARDEAAEAAESLGEAAAGAGYVPTHEAFAVRAVHGAGIEPQPGLIKEAAFKLFGGHAKGTAVHPHEVCPFKHIEPESGQTLRTEIFHEEVIAIDIVKQLSKPLRTLAIGGYRGNDTEGIDIADLVVINRTVYATAHLIVWGDERAEGGIPEEIFNCPLDTLYAIGAGFQASVPQRLWTRSYTSAHPFSVGPNDSSQSNPDLNDNWENLDAIYLNTKDLSGESESVTAPWANGSSSILDTTFRYDTKKEDGWQMLFHTFKEATYEAEQENYMCFYNPNTGIIKMLYFYEPNSHYEGFEKVLTCIKDGKVTFADNTIESDGILVFPNKLSNTEEQVYCGWNGFIYQVPLQDTNAEPRTSILIANN